MIRIDFYTRFVLEDGAERYVADCKHKLRRENLKEYGFVNVRRIIDERIEKGNKAIGIACPNCPQEYSKNMILSLAVFQEDIDPSAPCDNKKCENKNANIINGCRHYICISCVQEYE